MNIHSFSALSVLALVLAMPVQAQETPAQVQAQERVRDKLREQVQLQAQETPAQVQAQERVRDKLREQVQQRNEVRAQTKSQMHQNGNRAANRQGSGSQRMQQRTAR